MTESKNELVKIYDKVLKRSIKYNKVLFTEYAKFTNSKIGSYEHNRRNFSDDEHNRRNFSDDNQKSLNIEKDYIPYITQLIYQFGGENAPIILRNMYWYNLDYIRIRSFTNEINTIPKCEFKDSEYFPFHDINEPLKGKTVEVCYFNNKKVSDIWNKLLLQLFNISIKTYLSIEDCEKYLHKMQFKIKDKKYIEDSRLNPGSIYHILAEK